MKKNFTLSLDLTPSQVVRFNELLEAIKVLLTAGPKELSKVYSKPPKEFIEVILDIKPLEEPKVASNKKLHRLNESYEPSAPEVTIADYMNLLRIYR